MRKFLLYFALTLLLAVLLGYTFQHKSSYVLLSYEGYAFETSLWFFSFLLVLVFVGINFLFGFFKVFYQPRKRFNLWAENRRVVAAKRDFFQGIVDYETGAWNKALKKFDAASANLERPMVAFLYSARTANKLQRKDLKEEYLQKALNVEPESALAIGLVKAQLLQDEGDSFEVDKVLTSLKQAAPKNVVVKSLAESQETSKTEDSNV